jgi:hypothetical protein
MIYENIGERGISDKVLVITLFEARITRARGGKKIAT